MIQFPGDLYSAFKSLFFSHCPGIPKQFPYNTLYYNEQENVGFIDVHVFSSEKDNESRAE